MGNSVMMLMKMHPIGRASAERLPYASALGNLSQFLKNCSRLGQRGTLNRSEFTELYVIARFAVLHNTSP